VVGGGWVGGIVWGAPTAGGALGVGRRCASHAMGCFGGKTVSNICQASNQDGCLRRAQYAVNTLAVAYSFSGPRTRGWVPSWLLGGVVLPGRICDLTFSVAS
jgi:hypothetical protein